MKSKSEYPCKATACENYGQRCFRHCNHCFKPIKWRPSALDKEIPYAGPKPLNLDDTVHRCMLSGTTDGQYYDTRKAIPSHISKHFRNIAETGVCNFPDCYFNKIEKEKDPKIYAEWNLRRAEWLKKWPVFIGE